MTRRQRQTYNGRSYHVSRKFGSVQVGGLADGLVTVGKVKRERHAWVRHYKTVPPKFYDGFEATFPDGTREMFHYRRDAVAALIDAYIEGSHQ